MAGHNKWSKIKHKKAATDAKKSQVFSKIVKLIAVESKKVGGDATAPGLKTAIDKAKSVNMPSDNIERAIKTGASQDASTMEAITYEAYGPGGVAMVIEALTDNRNKASAEVKHILSKNSLSLASIGSATWAFTREGTDWIPTSTTPIEGADAEKLEKIIEELEDNDEVQEVFTNAE